MQLWAPHVFPAEGYNPSALEAVQLEDGSTAYIQHPVSVPSDSTILAVHTEVGLEDLAAEDDEGFSADTVVALEQYASKVSSQSLALPASSLGPAKTAVSLKDKTAPHSGMARAAPSAPVPGSPAHLSHVIVPGMHRSLAGAPDSCLHSPLFMLPAEGRRL